MKEHNIYARRYFYPLITDFPMYRGLASAALANVTIANHAAQQVLCLPIYPNLTDTARQKVVDIIVDTHA